MLPVLHPVFRLVATEPVLLAEHASAYASLFSEELAQASARLQRALAWRLVALGCWTAAATLAGTALLLWGALPEPGVRLPWVLGAVPLLPGLLGFWALWMARERPAEPAFATLRLQLARDAALLRSLDVP